MKYWWLEKYQNFKIIQMKELLEDVNYFLTMPKNYEKKYQQLKDKDINTLEEEELLIILKKIVNTKNIKDGSLIIIINKLLKIPDNSFPSSDYTFGEMLEEIKNLKTNPPVQNKIENNNIGICYHCLNIFYVDKIKKVNKNNLCLCPYCLKPKLYFDNDYIPMNYSFIKLASIYYGISNLGCTFKEIKKIVKKGITTSISKQEEIDIDLSNIFCNKKIKPIDEKIISRKLYQEIMIKENMLMNKVTIFIPTLTLKTGNYILEIILITLLEVLSNTVYLKEIEVVFEKEKDEKIFSSLLKIIKTFH